MNKVDNKFTIVIGGWWTHALGIAFVVLKLTHYINWSWWWVTSPFWIPWAIIIGMLVFFGILHALLKAFD